MDLNCTVGGLPEPVVRWKKDGHPFGRANLTSPDGASDESISFSDNEQRIHFAYVTPRYGHKIMFLFRLLNCLTKVGGETVNTLSFFNTENCLEMFALTDEILEFI